VFLTIPSVQSGVPTASRPHLAVQSEVLPGSSSPLVVCVLARLQAIQTTGLFRVVIASLAGDSRMARCNRSPNRYGPLTTMARNKRQKTLASTFGLTFYRVSTSPSIQLVYLPTKEWTFA
jgi:hypothetical protein